MDIFLKRTQTVLKDIQRGETGARRDRGEDIGASGSPTLTWHSQDDRRVPDYWIRDQCRVPGKARHDFAVRLAPGKDELYCERSKDIEFGDEVILA